MNNINFNIYKKQFILGRFENTSNLQAKKIWIST